MSRIKVTESKFKTIKRVLKKYPAGNKLTASLSISTLNKIKKAHDYDEYLGKKPIIRIKAINKKDKKYATLMDQIINETLKQQYLGGCIKVEWISPQPKWYQRLPIIRIWTRWLNIN